MLSNIRHVMAGGDPSKDLIPDEALAAFMAHCSKRIGDASFRTPGNTVKSFVHFLSILDQNPSANWRQLLGGVEITADTKGKLDLASSDDNGDDLVNLKL